MRKISLLLLLVVLAAGSVWGEVVEIPDPNLRAALEKALGKNEGDAITKEDLAKITSIESQEKAKIVSLTGLEYCTNLMSLDISNAKIIDLSPLSNLINLESLSLGSNQIVDLTPLLNLTNLKHLNLLGIAN